LSANLSFLKLSAISDRPAGAIGSVIWHFDAVPSTNGTLRVLLEKGQAAHGSVVVADEQKAGRGRQGRIWQADPGSGLLFSIFLEPLEPAMTYCMAALAARDAIADVTKQRPTLKWPNDVLIGGRKVCGILVEQVREGAIVGIGTNTNMTPGELARIGPEATSLAQISGRGVDHADLLERLLRRLEEQYIRISRSPQVVFEDWRSALTTVGQTVEVETSREIWIGRAVDVATDGALLVTNNKRLVRVYAANVRIRS
jgi:BirA family transcriptional regulator, biotin operon repressor / biotin---[acetyl-CoA-carboxylase] ligase